MEPSPSSKRTRSRLYPAFLLVLFGLVSFFLYITATAYQQAVAGATLPEETVMVAVAARDLTADEAITADDLYAVQVPVRFLAGGVFLNATTLVDSTPNGPIYTNEFIRTERLANQTSAPESLKKDDQPFLEVITNPIEAYQRQVYNWVQNQDLLNDQNMTQVVMPQRPIPAGQPITQDDLVTRWLPAEFIPDYILTTSEALVGRVPNQPLLPFEMVHPKRLTSP